MSDTGMVKVRILTETHEHEGKKVPKGAMLDVSPRTAKHFAEIGAAEAVAGTPSATPAAPATGTASAAASATKATGGVE